MSSVSHLFFEDITPHHPCVYPPVIPILLQFVTNTYYEANKEEKTRKQFMRRNKEG